MDSENVHEFENMFMSYEKIPEFQCHLFPCSAQNMARFDLSSKVHTWANTTFKQVTRDLTERGGRPSKKREKGRATWLAALLRRRLSTGSGIGFAGFQVSKVWVLVLGEFVSVRKNLGKGSALEEPDPIRMAWWCLGKDSRILDGGKGERSRPVWGVIQGTRRRGSNWLDQKERQCMWSAEEMPRSQ